MLLNNEWSSFLQKEIQSNSFIQLQKFVQNEYKNKIVFPKYENIFRAFNLLSPSEVKVVIIGQDPYHGVNQANGLAFSVYHENKIPPSLVNIFKELVYDTHCKFPSNGDLTKWALEGVLLINAVLTVVESLPHSHKNIGWEDFTDRIIQKLSDEKENLVFILWGNPSQKKEKFIDGSKHLILKAPHPSPLSCYRGFFGSHPFSKTNDYLRSCANKEIDWCLS